MRAISYVTYAQIEDYACSYYEKNGYKTDFKKIVTYLFSHNLYTTGLPDLPYHIMWSKLSDEEFYTLLRKLPIQNIFADYRAVPEMIPAAPIMPSSLEVFSIYYVKNIVEHMHSHDFFEINYVFSGECRMLFENESRSLPAGDLCIISPGSRHDVYTVGDSIAVSFMIRKDTFETTFFRLLAQKDLLAVFFRNILYSETTSANYLLFSTDNSEIIRDSIKDIFMECYLTDLYSNTCAVSRIHLLFSLLLRRYSHSIRFYDDEKSLPNHVGFTQILQYIQNHYQTVTLHSLCEVFHYNASYLSRLIRRHTGHSLMEILTDLKLTKAAELLRNTQLSITEITKIVGYDNTDHFSRQFKKKYSAPPTVYRSEHPLSDKDYAFFAERISSSPSNDVSL